MKCLSSWSDNFEILTAFTKTATEVAELALYSTSEDCAKHVCVWAGPPLSEAVIGIEKSHLIFLQAWSLWCVPVVFQFCDFSMVSAVGS